MTLLSVLVLVTVFEMLSCLYPPTVDSERNSRSGDGFVQVPEAWVTGIELGQRQR